MNKYDGNMSMCGYVHINMFIYSSVFVHGFSGLFFTGVRWWPMAINASKVVYQRKTSVKTKNRNMKQTWNSFNKKNIHNLRLSPCSFHVHHFKSLIYIQNIHIWLSKLHFICQQLTKNDLFNLFNFTHRSPHRSLPKKNRCPQRRSVVVTSLKQNGDVPTTPPEQRETNPENDILLYWLVHRDPYIREILDTLGMVPLIINPIYTLYSVYLLGIFHVGHQMNWILLMDKILHHQGWWLSHYW